VRFDISKIPTGKFWHNVLKKHPAKLPSNRFSDRCLVSQSIKTLKSITELSRGLRSKLVVISSIQCRFYRKIYTDSNEDLKGGDQWTKTSTSNLWTRRPMS
jgi:hypothetical protein